MSDELDQDLSRWFEQANRPLPGVDFQERLSRQLNGRNGWLSAAQMLISTTRAVLAGMKVGIAGAFNLRSGSLRLVAVSGTAVMLWLTLTI
jgi:hypothetical protein